MRRLLLLALIGVIQVAAQSEKLTSPPMILNLGSNVSDGSVSVACIGKTPYSQVSCKVYRLSISRPSAEEYQKSRTRLQKFLDAESEAADLPKLRQDLLIEDERRACSDLQSVSRDLEKNLKSYSPGRAASERDSYEQTKALCACATKHCFASVMLGHQTHEQNYCKVHSTAFSVDFVKVSDRKWVSNNGPEGICGVVSVFTIEHEPSSTSLWTYTEHYTFTNTSTGGCKGLPNSESSTYSWKSGTSVRLKCEEFTFDSIPEWQ